ncbi:Aste57867_1283 [Aphanomyces stellatus]|uniref:Aste57867_1283 protein n=1 Tax=Aphanomyces stellatus TaxID=120398 RepID=A0A485K4Y9_9STRA|nr:hypothetical protein As57867_001282 [Aphanomyces stellatus]VFT78502.1 Aste57867_1283 [Aphanomyces stellatus]
MSTPTSSIRSGVSGRNVHAANVSLKKRLHEKHRYAQTRARTCMRLLDKSSGGWHSHGVKAHVELFKTSMKDVAAARAVTTIPGTTLPHVVKTLFDSSVSSARFQHFWRAVFPTTYVHAELIDDLMESPSPDEHQRATTKWYALQPSKLRRPLDYYVMEWMGITTAAGLDGSPTITSCYLFQESMADIGGLPPLPTTITTDQDRIDALLVHFERAGTSSDVRMSVVVQKPPPPLGLSFGAATAVEFAWTLARGMREALQSTPRPALRPRACHHCAKSFHLFRRKAACATCRHAICQRAACAVTCPLPSPSVAPPPNDAHVLAELGPWGRRAASSVLPPLEDTAADDDVINESDVTRATTFQSASAWSMHADVHTAVGAAWRDLRAALLDGVTFMTVHYSSHVDAVAVQQVLRHVAPDVAYLGGTIGRGICDDDAWVAPSTRSGVGLVALFGIYDPDGQYAVTHTEYDSPAAAARNVSDMLARCVLPSPPTVAVVFATPLFMEPVMSVLAAVPVVGGCATDANQQPWNQISSACDGVTSNGLALALCAPSVETRRCWFTGYDVIGHAKVTAVDGTTILTLDHMPAAAVYAQTLGPARSTAHSFPRLGNLHPLAVDDGSMRVVVGIDGDALALSGPIAVGATVSVMELNRDTLMRAMTKVRRPHMMSTDMMQWGDQVQALGDVQGCLMFFSASVQVLLGSQRMVDMVSAYKAWSGNASFLGLSTFGQLGGESPATTTTTYDPLMFSALLFTSRKNKLNL